MSTRTKSHYMVPSVECRERPHAWFVLAGDGETGDSWKNAGIIYFYCRIFNTQNDHMTTKSTNIVYWISTIVFAALMIFSASGGLQPSKPAIQLIHDTLGYPVYFIQFISIAKLVGCIVILIPGLNRSIKEWAYAGLFFDLAGAVYSGIATSGNF